MSLPPPPSAPMAALTGQDLRDALEEAFEHVNAFGDSSQLDPARSEEFIEVFGPALERAACG